MSEETDVQPVELATELTIAWLNNPNNRAVADDVPGFLRTMHATLTELAKGPSAPVEEEVKEEEFVPAVSVRRSLASKDHIISMIDGKPYKTLTRHLSTHGLTPQEYRQRYKLRSDYPMVAENYAAQRRELAKKIGLGRRSSTAAQSVAAPEPVVEAKSAPAAATKTKAATASKPRTAAASGTKPASPKSAKAPARRTTATSAGPSA